MRVKWTDMRNFIAAAGALLVLAACSAVPEPAPVPKRLQQEGGQRTPMTEWFYADDIIRPHDGAARAENGAARSPAASWLVVTNLASQTTSFKATFYFEDIEPRSFSRELPARVSQSFPLQDMSDIIPHGKIFGARVEAEGPVLVQPTRGEYEPHNSVTHAMSSFVAYPGPLGRKETRWAYADGLVLRSDGPLEEWEWISILNPNPTTSADIRVRFLLPDGEREHRLSVPAERVRTVDLFHLDEFPRNVLAGVIVESDSPVVVEQIRRAYSRGVPVITSLWATLAHPIGDLEIE
jgi:hypothetical protein